MRSSLRQQGSFFLTVAAVLYVITDVLQHYVLPFSTTTTAVPRGGGVNSPRRDNAAASAAGVIPFETKQQEPPPPLKNCTSILSSVPNSTIRTTEASSFTVYGHLHYAKTAGTTLNGRLASQYERVCGNRGYSYDAYQFNQRVEQQLHQHNRTSIPAQQTGQKDAINKAFEQNWNRGRVPPAVMEEIGYENCDYISLEDRWTVWDRLLLHNNNDNRWKLELHIPCRDPLDHLLSQCNHRRHTFDCHSELRGSQEGNLAVSGLSRPISFPIGGTPTTTIPEPVFRQVF